MMSYRQDAAKVIIIFVIIKKLQKYFQNIFTPPSIIAKKYPTETHTLTLSANIFTIRGLQKDIIKFVLTIGIFVLDKYFSTGIFFQPIFS